MSTWTRAEARWRKCGKCGHPIGIGDPVLVMTFGKATLVRCATCAGGAPPDLPARIELTKRPRLDVAARFGLLPLEFSKHGQEE